MRWHGILLKDWFLERPGGQWLKRMPHNGMVRIQPGTYAAGHSLLSVSCRHLCHILPKGKKPKIKLKRKKGVVPDTEDSKYSLFLDKSTKCGLKRETQQRRFSILTASLTFTVTFLLLALSHSLHTHYTLLCSFLKKLHYIRVSLATTQRWTHILEQCCTEKPRTLLISK